MKIIGKCGTSYAPSYLVEISEEELRCLSGNKYSDQQFAVGQSWNVGKLYDQLSGLYCSRNERAEVAKRLRAYADLIIAEPHAEIVGPDKKEEIAPNG